ncbi:RHS repeat-associated core domain-containing protein [Stenotrophomonas sp. 278]|uniref:RHS repeat domain-containing protein n=1 Tax=Stenotrophomonas sp. 278 TaxID=2479851 RepID=UPI001639AC9F|nr:RHS repeat-associated core domain-containing protein [Stenotrophomonas sp. 278]
MLANIRRVTPGRRSMALPVGQTKGHAMSASTSVNSNAFNFASYVQHGVDPRTGQYTISLALPEIKSSALAGPSMPLTLGFSPMNTADVGFGQGWTFNLTEYDVRTRILSLGSGETFKVTGSGSQPAIAEKKLDTFHFHEEGDVFRVVHRSGTTEVLQRPMGTLSLARPQKVVGADGRALILGYTPFAGVERLESIRDDAHELVRIERDNVTERVHILLFPGEGPGGEAVARFTLHLDGQRRVSRVELPMDGACWRLSYKTLHGFNCLDEVWTPCGAHETISYGGEGHLFPGAARDPIPRVTRHEVDPGFEQAPMIVEYEYSTSNFLGYGALSAWDPDGLDNLYNVTDDTFSYYSIAKLLSDSAPVRLVKRTYNRFHLMTEESTAQGKCRKRVETDYFCDLPENRHKPLSEQPAICQLPMQVNTVWEITDDSRFSRTETSGKRFDDHGNLIEEINTDGTREVTEYYPAEGEGDRCPRDPDGFVRTVKSRTVYPAETPNGHAPVLRTDYTYRGIQSLPWDYGTYFLAESSQVLAVVQGDELKRIDTEYHEDVDDLLRFGRNRAVTETLNGAASVTAFCYERRFSDIAGEEVLATTETLTGFDNTQQSIMAEYSLRSGQPRVMRGLEGIEVRRSYDALNRVTSETISPGTEFVARITHEYHLVGGDEDPQAWKVTTDLSGVKTMTRLDGLSRTVLERRQDVDATSAAGVPINEAPFRDIYRAHYDDRGDLESEVHVDWLLGEDRPLTTTYAYDDWGEDLRTTRPDGVVEVTERSPFGTAGPVERSWLENAGNPDLKTQLRVIAYNRFGKVDSEEYLDDSGEAFFTLQHIYDGLGQSIEQHEQFDGQERITKTHYDAWRRVRSAVLPNGTAVNRVFAGHSSDEHPVELRVKPSNINLPEVLLATQTFDGLDRLVSRTVGGRTLSLDYEGGRLMPRSRTTPAGKLVELKYEEQLGEAPREITAPDDWATFTYDKQSGAMLGTRNARGERGYVYSPSGELTQEVWKVEGQEACTSDFQTSRLGRSLTRKDQLPGTSRQTVTTSCRYDAAGRLEWTEQGVVRARIEYDALGRVWRTTTQNVITRQELVTEVGYDCFSREMLRTLTVDGQVFQVSQEWSGDSQLSRRTLTQEGRVRLDESFYYDRHSRLQRHACEGDLLPQDRLGNPITSQVFTYDDLDNITRCTTFYADGSMDPAVYDFSGVDPCQLIRITHRHDAYPTPEEFAYDADGNLSNDPEGRTLSYDSLGRLLSMGSAQGTLHYHYDGHGELAGVVNPDGTETTRFYQDYQLSHEVRGETVTHVLHADGVPLAYSAGKEINRTRLLLTNAVATVIAEARQSELVTAAYTAYGESDGTLAFLLGFNAEPRQHGWYLLGRGYRAYNPYLKRFNRPDSESPFGLGGLNPYMYCQGNPVAFQDPSGHIVRDTPEYFYPPPPPPPPPKPKGGGWMKWLGVAIAGVFLVVSAVTAPWSLGVTAPAMITALKGMAIQAVGLAMQVIGTVTEDPTLQMVMMIGSMAAGVVGGMVTAKGAAAGKALIKSQKAAQMKPITLGRNASVPSGPSQATNSFAKGPEFSPRGNFANFTMVPRVSRVPGVGTPTHFINTRFSGTKAPANLFAFAKVGGSPRSLPQVSTPARGVDLAGWTQTNKIGRRAYQFA